MGSLSKAATCSGHYGPVKVRQKDVMDVAMVVGETGGVDPVGPWTDMPVGGPGFGGKGPGYGGPRAQEMGFEKRYLARRKGRKTNAVKTWVVWMMEVFAAIARIQRLLQAVAAEEQGYCGVDLGPAAPAGELTGCKCLGCPWSVCAEEKETRVAQLR